MNKSNRLFAVQTVLIAAVLVALILAYPHLPAMVATHFGMNMQPDAYSPKWQLFLFGPGVMAGLLLLAVLAPWLSPGKFSTEAFEETFLESLLIIQAMLAYCCGVTLLAELGYVQHPGRALVAGLCVLFIALGNLLGKVRPNFFLGIRTPWTLASEPTWVATHRLAAKTFFAGGLLGLIFTLCRLPGSLTATTLGLAALIPCGYSLYFYKRLAR